MVRTALADAGYAERPFPREQTAVVLGMGGGAAQLAMGYAFRSYLPMLDTVLPAGGQAGDRVVPGACCPNGPRTRFPASCSTSRRAGSPTGLNLGGANYTVDAACGSSLAAAALAVRELETGAADMVILGGVDTVQNPFTYLAFSKTQAFSPRGRCRPFDAGADGIVISEGVAAVVLKRLADAERDGDRIYAVIKGVGASSDGRARGLTAPVVEGPDPGPRARLRQGRRLAGDGRLRRGARHRHRPGRRRRDRGARPGLPRRRGRHERDCVVGSVKSLIGHTKCAAGLAGLINASLALYHKVLPPTIGIETPNPKLDLRDGPFRLCTQAQPWLHPDADRPRRAGVSAFGFGGTNFHAVLEAYDRNVVAEPESTAAATGRRSCWSGRPTSRPQLVAQLDQLAAALEAGARPALCDLSHTLIRARELRGEARPKQPAPTLAIVADVARGPARKADAGAGGDRGGPARASTIPAASSSRPSRRGPDAAGGVPVPGPGRAVAGHAPRAGGRVPRGPRRLSRSSTAPCWPAGAARSGPLVFPPPAFDDAAREEARRASDGDRRGPAGRRGRVRRRCCGCLRSLGCEPDMLGGHSYGELVALHAAGVLSAAALAELSPARGPLHARGRRGARRRDGRPPGRPRRRRAARSARCPACRPPTGTARGRR